MLILSFIEDFIWHSPSPVGKRFDWQVFSVGRGRRLGPCRVGDARIIFTMSAPSLDIQTDFEPKNVLIFIKSRIMIDHAFEDFQDPKCRINFEFARSITVRSRCVLVLVFPNRSCRFSPEFSTDGSSEFAI